MRDSTDYTSIEELFDTIDNIGNSNNENDKIMEEIMYKFQERVDLKFEHQLEKTDIVQKIINECLSYLYDFLQLIEEQITTIEQLSSNLDTSSYDEINIFKKIQKELDEYNIKKYMLEFKCVSDLFNEKECDIYQSIRSYTFLNKYHEKLKEVSVDQTNQETIKKHNKITDFDWKTYYYLIICMEKQKDINQLLLSNYISRRKNIDDIKFFLSKSKLFASDFQSQVSKSVFCQRKRKKLTQSELSKISGVDRSMIAKIEKINQPTTLETAIKLLSALNMGIAIYPLGGSGDEILSKLKLYK